MRKPASLVAKEHLLSLLDAVLHLEQLGWEGVVDVVNDTILPVAAMAVMVTTLQTPRLKKTALVRGDPKART